MKRHSLTHPYVSVDEGAFTIIYDVQLGEYYLHEERQIYRGISNLAETKFEFRLDLRYRYKGYQFSLYYENEYVLNYEFKDHGDIKSRRSGNIFWFAFEKDISGTMLNWLNK